MQQHSCSEIILECVDGYSSKKAVRKKFGKITQMINKSAKVANTNNVPTRHAVGLSYPLLSFLIFLKFEILRKNWNHLVVHMHIHTHTDYIIIAYLSYSSCI